MAYSEKLIDHFEHPRNVGTLDKNAQDVGTGMVGAPACGDVMRLQIKVNPEGVIEDAKFKTYGCGSAIASSSLVSEWVKGKTLEEAGKTVVITDVADACCMKLGVRAKCKAISTAAPDCIVCMSCGDGVQTIAKNCTGIPVYPANNTMFLGEVARVGIWEEACKMCGDCVLGTTGGICPITQCAKSLVNGPCGGQKNGKCEVNPENDCAWIQIYKRLEQLGQLDKLTMTRPDKGYEKVAYPRTINQRGKKA